MLQSEFSSFAACTSHSRRAPDPNKAPPSDPPPLPKPLHTLSPPGSIHRSMCMAGNSPSSRSGSGFHGFTLLTDNVPYCADDSCIRPDLDDGMDAGLLFWRRLV